MPSGLIQYCHRLPKPPRPQTFIEWRAGLKADLAQKRIPVKDLPDGTIIAQIGNQTKIMTDQMQHGNYQAYLDKLLARG